jgi:two-component system chemotaxis response regulator CheB
MVKVMIVAVSIRLSTLRKRLDEARDVQVVRYTDNLQEAEAALASPDFQVVVMDYALQFIRPLVARCKSKKIPSICIVPNVTAGFDMMERGATDMIVREASLDTPSDMDTYFYRMLAIRIRDAIKKEVGRSDRKLKNPAEALGKGEKFVVIGSSTGGTEAVTQILQHMPPMSPPILIVQHMPCPPSKSAKPPTAK